MAAFQNKRIIPIFENFEDVPLIFQPVKGINISGKNLKEVVTELVTHIFALTGISSDEAQELIQLSEEYQIGLRDALIYMEIKNLVRDLGENTAFATKAQGSYLISIHLRAPGLTSLPKSILELTSLQSLILERTELDDQTLKLLKQLNKKGVTIKLE